MKNDNRMEYNIMTLNGSGEITAIPDTALIRLGVLTTGDNLTDIQQENAKISQEILETLHQFGIEDIKTFQYTIDKLYDFENGVRIDKGYSVRNIFEIRTQQLDNVGEIIDLSVNHGANVVDVIAFEVTEPEQYYNQALKYAVMDAIKKAESIAYDLRVDLNPVPVNIIENSNVPSRMSQNLFLREGATVTPIEPGTKQISAFITAKFMY